MKTDDYVELRRLAGEWPSIVAIIPARQVTLTCEKGSYYDLSDKEVSDLVEHVSHVLVGAFDERSVIMWTRKA